MPTDEPLLKLLEQALQLVLKESPPDWDEQLDVLDARLRKLESRLRADEAEKQAQVKEAAAPKSRPEPVPVSSSTDLQNAMKDFDRDMERQRGIEDRLQGVEKKVLRVLRDK
jgi:hypothetical protein